jgi:inosose dehydratase
MIRFANAPCSWGTIEGWGQSIGYKQMLDELVQTGYSGTELGDYGYMPTDAKKLRRELKSRGLTMLGSYEGVYLRDPKSHADGEQRVLRNARLMKSVADVGDGRGVNPTADGRGVNLTADGRGVNLTADGSQPFVVLADEHSRNQVRFENAGRIKPQMGLSESAWKTFARGANRIAKAVNDETGLRVVFHHHCAGYVETPDEIDELLSRTNPKLIGLVLDTGHFLYGSGQSDGNLVLDALERFRERIWYVHFKDCHPKAAKEARSKGLNYKEAIGKGVFCELGQGSVNFKKVTKKLLQMGYDGWITVEQDVLPGMGEPKESARRNREYLRRVTGI